MNQFLIKNKDILHFTSDEELNSLFQQFIFAQAFHAFLSSIFFKKENLLIVGFISISFAYGITAIIDKNRIRLVRQIEEV